MLVEVEIVCSNKRSCAALLPFLGVIHLHPNGPWILAIFGIALRFCGFFNVTACVCFDFIKNTTSIENGPLYFVLGPGCHGHAVAFVMVCVWRPVTVNYYCRGCWLLEATYRRKCACTCDVVPCPPASYTAARTLAHVRDLIISKI